MTKKIFGILFIIYGISVSIGIGYPHPNIVAGLIGIGIGLYLYYSSKNAPKRTHIKKENESLGTPVKTFSFRATGFRFACRFPTNRFKERQNVLIYCKLGDPISLRQFEWEGAPAFAIISNKCGADFSVVPAEHVNAVLDLTEKYIVRGKIIELERIEYRKETYTVASVELDCYEKVEEMKTITN